MLLVFFVISLNKLTQKPHLFLCAIIVTGSIMQLLAFAIEGKKILL